uniref:Bm13166 n=1 Tax=Brugia malayi TaxID=6279 RepID=A0A1I9G4H3_BRUMA|nr:Bm13166 [Brugia malayi]
MVVVCLILALFLRKNCYDNIFHANDWIRIALHVFGHSRDNSSPDLCIIFILIIFLEKSEMMMSI